MSNFIRDQIAQALTGDAAQYLPIVDGTLTKFTDGNRGGTVSAGRTRTPVPYPMRCLVKPFKDGDIDGTIVKQDDRKVSIVGGTLPDGVLPEVSDTITANGITYRIIGGNEGKGVTWDPAEAMYRCHGRR